MTLESPIPTFVPVWHALQLADAAASERDDEELLIIISDARDALVQIQRRIRSGEAFDDSTGIRTGNRTSTA